MSSTIDEIKEKLDIVQVVSEYLQLKKVGANYRALCPFHSEKTPSFYVSPSKQIFKCFGCSKSGDIFKFIMEIEGVDFPEALQILAKKAGVELKKESPQKRTERQRQYEICELAAKFFEAQLKRTKTGEKVKNYLLSRGISEDSIKEWRLGYAPDTWQGLSDFLVGKGYKREEVVKAGLAIQRENINEYSRGSYDRFRGRIMFPIFDIQGNVIGFGGRITEEQREKLSKEKGEEPAKYINTPNTLIYDKSWVLYGLHKAKTEIREKDAVVLVEGYTDVILSSQTNIKNVVSTSGTALTPFQLKILARYSKNLLLCFDMDIAGEAATKKGIDIAQKEGFNIKIVDLPEDKDPADIVKENPKKWQGYVKKAKDIIDFYLEKSLNSFDSSTVEGKKKISEVLLPLISQIQNKIEQGSWVQKLSKAINLNEEIIWEEIKRVANKRQFSANTTNNSDDRAPLAQISDQKKSQQRQLEERLLMLLLKFPQQDFSKFKFLKFSFPEGQQLFDCLKENKKPPKKLEQFISELELQFEVENEKEPRSDPRKEIQFCFLKLEELSKHKKIEALTQKLKEAENQNDKEKIEKILKKLNNINNK